MTIQSPRMLGGYLPLRDAMNLLFEGSFISPESVGRQSTYPPVDVLVTDDDVIVEMALPGGNPDNLSISMTGESLVISGEVKRQRPNEKAHLYLQEIWQGTFQRSFTLPVQVEYSQANASFVDGILTLRLPKADAAKRHTIQVERQPMTIVSDKKIAIEDDVQVETVPTPGTEVLVH